MQISQAQRDAIKSSADFARFVFSSDCPDITIPESCDYDNERTDSEDRFARILALLNAQQNR